MKLKMILMSLIGLLVISSFTIPTVLAQSDSSTLYVGGYGDGNFSSITNAIFEAGSGGTIMIYSGVYNETVVIDKSINIVGVNKEETIVNGNGLDNVFHIIASDVSISNLTIRKSGIAVLNTSDSGSGSSFDESGGLKPVDAKNELLTMHINFSGVFSEYDDTTVSSCVFKDCNSGIIFRNVSSGSIFECDFTNNSKCGYIINSKNLDIHSCNLFGNGIGFYFINSWDVQIYSCEIFSNIDTGLMFSTSDSNLVYNNHFENNSFGIILINNCFGNIFYQNNFIANRQQHARDNCNNSWDNGLIGNYWDDYTGTDDDSDGIGDEAYFILMVSHDFFPLMSAVQNSVDEISITVISPSDNENVSGNLIIKGSVSSETEIDSVNVRINDEEWFLADGTENWEATIDTNNYENGSHDLYVSAVNSDDVSSVEHLIINIENIDDGNGGSPEDVPGFAFLLVVAAVFMAIIVIKPQ